ncbi:Pancreatic triacylglycerol lipase [Hypsibius exemplaris]|uniref:Pancreatic triacylglycerol lipase n=1 Tax=Hypsibius exemplaris TaxID=2072580 RepID=A0A1W0XAQ2_HYPEX|nr:Pancreatic triacylglycerol lipase [Hypsibius exemplaris]
MSATAVLLAVTLTVGLCLVAAGPSSRISNKGTEPRKSRAVIPVVTRQVVEHSEERAEACCADLGCYSTGGDFFHIPLRPFNSLPRCALKNDLKLHLNTRRNPVDTQVLDPYDASTLFLSNFNAVQKTQIIIHGFIDNFQWPWWKNTIVELLKNGDHNVIRLDWSHGNTPPYTQAVANLRLVGAYVAKFIHHLVTIQGVNPADIHIIGHSLGAHGAGYSGSVAQSSYNITVGRITGLDPAGPYYTNLPVSVRLDPSDAAVVDTIVTDGHPHSILQLALGSPQPMGHINFYPNGGLEQPGCERGIISGIFQGPTMNASGFDFFGTVAATAFEAVACSHARAPVLFHESINNPACTMKSFECSDYESFLRGECFTCRGRRCADLGFHADISLASQYMTKNYYTITTEKSPFCTSPHKLEFTLQPKTSANGASSKHGLVYVTLYGTLATSAKVLLTPESIDLDPGSTYTFFFETPRELGTVQSIVFSWTAKIELFNPLEWFLTDYIHIEGNLFLTEQDELVSVFQPARSKVEEDKDLLSTLIHSFEQL